MILEKQDQTIEVPKLSSPLAFDFETIANEDIVGKLPEPKPDSRLKDPEKIKADIEKKKAKAVDKMPLNPNTARIVACGFAGVRADSGELWQDCLVMTRQTGEAYLLYRIWDCLAESKLFVTFNGNGFDLPMLLRRGMALNIIPAVTIARGRYDIPPKGNHYDLLQILSSFGSMETGGLDGICKAVLGVGKTIEGAGESDQIGELWKQGKLEEIGKRASHDAGLTLQLWLKARGVYFDQPAI